MHSDSLKPPAETLFPEDRDSAPERDSSAPKIDIRRQSLGAVTEEEPQELLNGTGAFEGTALTLSELAVATCHIGSGVPNSQVKRLALEARENEQQSILQRQCLAKTRLSIRRLGRLKKRQTVHGIAWTHTSSLRHAKVSAKPV